MEAPSHFWRNFAICLILCMELAGIRLAVAQQKRIYIAPDDHTDYMWSGNENAYRKAFLDMTEYYLDLADKTQANPPAFQSKWNFDGSIWMWTWEHNRDHAQVERLVKRIRDGHISMPLNFAVSTYGGQPTEAVLRGMYYAGEVERRYGLRFPLAVAMEDQTLPRGLGALWAGSGAEYSWRGVCACATKMKPVIDGIRPHQIYWWKGPDGSRILMKWYSLFPGNREIGTYLEAKHPRRAINFVDTSSAFKNAYPYDIIGIFGEGGDDLSTTNDLFVRTAESLINSKQKVIVSNEVDFFRDFEKQYGANLPELSVSYGNEWDLYSASMADLSGSVRRAVEQLRPAEALATLVNLKEPGFYNKSLQARRDAWMALGLYWEHDWTADSHNIVSRAARADWQKRIAHKVTSYSDDLLASATKELGSEIIRHGKQPRYFVFNALNWPRTGPADLPYSGSEDVHVRDLSTGLTVPSQFVDALTTEGREKRVLRIWASEIPSVGYKVFEIVPGKGQLLPGGLHENGNEVENSYYRVKLDGRGAIESIVGRKFDDREFVKRVDGQYANDWGSGVGTVSVVNSGAVSITLQAKITGPIPRLTRITLYRDSDRIDIRNEILANFTDVRSWAFSFNLQSPDVWHEEVGAINHARLSPEGDYAAKFSRLDWLTLNHFAAMSGSSGVGITLSNYDCAFMKLGHSKISKGISYLDTSTPQISVLAGGQVDGPRLGIPDEGGEHYFLQRFSLQAYHHFSAESSMRFALESQNPLIAGPVSGGSQYPEKSFSLLATSNPALMLWALKPSEEGIHHGVVARFWNMTPRQEKFSVGLAGGISEAWNDTHIEVDLGRASVASGRLQADAAPWQLRTFRLQPSASPGNVALNEW